MLFPALGPQLVLSPEIVREAASPRESLHAMPDSYRAMRSVKYFR